MGEHERGRLCPIKVDGTEMEPFIINKKALYIGSGDHCGIRLYTDGIFPEHCVLTTDKKGKVYFKPLHPTALVLVNHVKITKKYPVKHNDIITILMRSFRFAYPANSVYSEVDVKTPTLPCTIIETNLLKCKNSSAKKSISPKTKVLPDFNDKTPGLRIKRSSTEMSREKKKQKKQRKFSLPGKRVRFGPKLTPEEFDKHLPPSSPLRRGSLPNKSLSISNESSTTFTVNVEVHSGPKEKVGSPVRKPQRKSISSNTKTGDFQPTSQISMPVDEFSKICELPITNVTPKSDKTVSSDLLQKDQKPLFSEVLKKLAKPSDNVSPGNKARSPQSNINMKKITSKYPKMQQKGSERLIHQQLLAVGSTGHANSPDTIILSKHRTTLQVDNTFKVNVRRSPRTPRRAKYTVERETSKNLAILLSQHATVEQVEKENIENIIITPPQKNRKTEEFLTAAGKASKESQEFKSDAGVFENILGDFVKSDLKMTPIQLKKTRNSQTESIRKSDAIHDDLCDLKTRETEELLPESIKVTKSEINIKDDFQLDCNIEICEITPHSDILLPKQNINVTVEQIEEENMKEPTSLFDLGESSKQTKILITDLCHIKIFEKSPKIIEIQDIGMTPTQSDTGKKRKENVKKDTLPIDLHNEEINGVSEKSTESNSQGTTRNEGEDVKKPKNSADNKSRKGRKRAQDTNENKVKELKKSSISKDENISSKSHLVNSSSNEKENEEGATTNVNTAVKQSRKIRKIVKVLNENEVIPLSDLGENLKDVNLKYAHPQNASAKRRSKEIPNTDVKLLQKRKKVKKDGMINEELKTTSNELSPCRRVTRSMAKKFSQK